MKLAKDKKIELCVCKDITRDHLAHPMLDVERKRLVATNGNVLVSIPVELEEGCDISGPVPVDAIKAGRKTVKAGDDFTVLVHQERVEVPAAPGMPRFKRDHEIASCFPKAKQVDTVIPNGKGHTVVIGIDARLLLDVAQALGSNIVELRIDPGNAAKGMEPYLVRAAVSGHVDDSGAVGVVMPHRIDNDTP
jgi:hypothetical protein